MFVKFGSSERIDKSCEGFISILFGDFISDVNVIDSKVSKVSVLWESASETRKNI